MNDYHFIALNLVVLITYMQMRAQEMCKCQNVNLDWSIYINEFWLQHLSNTFAKTVFSTTLIYILEFDIDENYTDLSNENIDCRFR